MPVSEHRPHARDSVARWQTYAKYLEAEIERLREESSRRAKLLEAAHDEACDRTAEVERLRYQRDAQTDRWREAERLRIEQGREVERLGAALAHLEAEIRYLMGQDDDAG